ncbi:uncharacterized protein A1O5_07336 [Cladophialophora psammophila CBS 110553]|uniref:H-type lectin domain-containing protein n=1 Tax=Cladophialophora psammophila CBS 110553 TaxID=1182543 RepID=W9WW61_9EURO|nr:uncharacterized protein A1O5_07336 [Cladophialophora psammophila CBS 110553]EXJ69300.1 hypothetical protein A1O5_07336 [Cladophialophora psammophila CBS 110553]
MIQGNNRKRPHHPTSSHINFSYKFDVAPKVVAWIDGLEMTSGKDWRMKVYATEIDLTGFTIHIDTWNDTVLYVGNASWAAWPASTPNVVTGAMKPEHVHDMEGTGYAIGDSVHVERPEIVKTERIPALLTGFGSFDLAHSDWMRLSEADGAKTTADDMDRQICPVSRRVGGLYCCLCVTVWGPVLMLMLTLPSRECSEERFG